MTQKLHSKTKFASSLLSAGVAAMFLLASVDPGSAAPPFAGMSGKWTGDGRVTMKDGKSEPIKCKATYTEGKSGTTLEQVLRCASDSYKFNVKSNLASEGGELSGDWTETTYSLKGTFKGKSVGPKIEGQVRGSGLRIAVALLTRGNSQQVRILSQGTQMREVTLKLNKR